MVAFVFTILVSIMHNAMYMPPTVFAEETFPIILFL